MDCIELMSCPFCGNSAEFVPYKNNGLTLKCTTLGCIQRNQRTLRYGIESLQRSMAEHWNTRAALTPPEGWVLVPVEPTDDMIHAAANARAGGGASYEVWHAMLAARPEVP